MLYEPQFYIAYLEHSKSHQLLSTLMAEGIPVSHKNEWSRKELCYPETIYLDLAQNHHHTVYDTINR